MQSLQSCIHHSFSFNSSSPCARFHVTHRVGCQGSRLKQPCPGIRCFQASVDRSAGYPLMHWMQRIFYSSSIHWTSQEGFAIVKLRFFCFWYQLCCFASKKQSCISSEKERHTGGYSGAGTESIGGFKSRAEWLCLNVRRGLELPDIATWVYGASLHSTASVA